MIAPRVPSEKEIFDGLVGLGFESTDTKTATGQFWKHKTSGRHIQVPFSVQGYYPDWLRAQFLPHAFDVATKLKISKPATTKRTVRRRAPSPKR